MQREYIYILMSVWLLFGLDRRVQAQSADVPVRSMLAPAAVQTSMSYLSLFFFFSSRRRHTRFDCDWSSDVCSSDLEPDQRPSARPRAVGYPAHVARMRPRRRHQPRPGHLRSADDSRTRRRRMRRSEEHTSELQSQSNLVCRLLLADIKPPSSPITTP